MLTLILFASLGADPVFSPGPAELERFKASFALGESLFQAGDYGAAIYTFHKADVLRATPEVAFDLAKCHEKLGDQAFALHYYRLYLRRAPKASDAIDIAQKIGQLLSVHDGTQAAFVEIEARGASALTFAGKRYPQGPVAAFVAPGEYELSGIFAGTLRKMVVSVKAGKAQTLDFEPLPPPMVASNGVPMGVLPGESLSRSEGGQSMSGPRIAGLTTVGASVAALAVATVLAVLSGADAQSATTDKTLTVSAAQGFANQANSKALGANTLFSVGAGALVGGGLLFFLSPATSEPKGSP